MPPDPPPNPSRFGTLYLPNGDRHVVSPLSDLVKKANDSLQAGRNQRESDNERISDAVREMRLNRMANLRKTADIGMAQTTFATGRSRDPMFYWRESNIPYQYEQEAELLKLRKFARLVYLTHPVIASCIDVYSSWPLTGMRLECRDPELADFYNDLFFNELDWAEFAPDVLHGYWSDGEAFPMGQFNQTMGIWEGDENINPDDVKVIKSPFLREPRFEMRVPQEIREIVTRREPEWEYRQLVRAYPELVRYAQTEEYMPVSNVLMKQIAFKPDKFFHRGIPIIMRAFRSIYQEEMLNAAVDAIASRLYTPLILVRLGATASDMGTDVAWVPTADQLQEFEMALDIALAADFRVLTSHFATQVDQVFGKENMPDFSADYDRLMDRQLLAFGLSRTLLMGADSGETYAADALNRDLVTTLLVRAQRYITKLYRARAKVVAEAHQHYDYEERGGKRYPIMEEKLIIDNDGTKSVVEQPKLLIPDMKFDVLNLNDKQLDRQFVEGLAQVGVIISQRTRMRNIGIDWDDEIQAVAEEQKRIAVETQQARKETYLALRQEGLPIPEDLERDFGPKVGGATEPSQGGEPFPNMMMDPVADSAPLSPTAEDYMAEAQEGGDPMAAAQGPLTPVPPMNMYPQRPPESDEARGRMPVAAHLNGSEGEAEGEAEYVSPYVEMGDTPSKVVEGPYRLLSGPSHLGKIVAVDPNEPLE